MRFLFYALLIHIHRSCSPLLPESPRRKPCLKSIVHCFSTMWKQLKQMIFFGISTSARSIWSSSWNGSYPQKSSQPRKLRMWWESRQAYVRSLWSKQCLQVSLIPIFRRQAQNKFSWYCRSFSLLWLVRRKTVSCASSLYPSLCRKKLHGNNQWRSVSANGSPLCRAKLFCYDGH